MEPLKFDIRNLPFAGTVTRWHSVNCHRYPSIAEHSCLVALYAREIAARVVPQLKAEQQVLLYELALLHDLSEIVTGDMPSPIKRALREHFEGQASPIDQLERAICPDAAQREDLAQVPEQSYLWRILKLADILDALVVIRQEGKGPAREVISQERSEAFESLLIKAQAEHPDLNWEGARWVRDRVCELKHVQLDEFGRA
ncbi:HD domain-containing protein [Litorivicinus lipolyticus]|uniref:HD domain-containing protein n=1 Tax=Litorivicinus lipolyticus TaxID=418701 RepID=A0A5Q2QBT9_9GAMM|nr:YfbR-like 5'-deoxynucleotidase [Litorivicinus lipolyticus]QGG80753.1 HD domain-containing protein [Litorivicinus lipolyticus]